MQELIGKNLGPYNIIEQIGVGGMATIFRAHQSSLNREVALKALPPHFAKRADFTEGFKREAQAIGSLRHPNILPVYDFGQDKGYSYLVMRYLPKAITLSDLMKQPLSIEQIRHIVNQIAAALDHAHQAGIIHQDVKPSNLLLDKDWVFLSDFGLAKMVDSSSELSAAGVGMATPAYMSPEQGMGEKVDHRADIYSLGVILYEMLTGQVPYQAETPIAVVMKGLNEAIPSPRSLNPDIPAAVEQVLLKALAFDPANRYDSAGELAEALQNAFEAPPRPASAPPGKIKDVVAQPAPARVSKGPAAAVVTDIPDMASLQAPRSKPRSVFEIVVLIILGLLSGCSIITLPSFLTANSGRIDFSGIFLGLGMLASSLSVMAMIWFRNRSRPVSGKLNLSILLWFIGVMIVSMGVFTIFSPSRTRSFWQNLGFSTAFCLGPGGLMVLAGALLYLREYRRGQQAETRARMAAFGATEAGQTRADKLKRAGEYVAHVDKFIKRNKNRSYIERMTPLRQKLRLWQKNLQQLVERLDAFDVNPIIQRDIKEVPAKMTRLQEQLAAEADPFVRTQIQEALQEVEEHRTHLEALSNQMRGAEFDLDESLATMGTIYSQLQLFSAKEIDDSRARRLSDDIDEEANRLDDLLAAMDEVYKE